MHCIGGPLSEWKDHASRGDSRPHRRDPASGQRRGRHQVGDNSKEARHHTMSVELSVATTTFMDDSYTFIDCPGSIEFIHDMRAALAGGRCRGRGLRSRRKEDAAIAAGAARARRSEDSAFPVPQQDRQGRQALRETLQILQPASRVPLLLRQIPIWRNDIITGFVDLALERAHVYKEHTASEVIELSAARTWSARRPRASPCWRRSPITTTN